MSAFSFFLLIYISLATSESREAPFIPTAKLSDLGGIDHCIEEIMELIAMPLAHPEVYLHTGVQPPRGVLLHGPPGCGKTRLAHAIAGELGVPFYNISAPSIVSGMSGESEKKIREVFEEARVSIMRKGICNNLLADQILRIMHLVYYSLMKLTLLHLKEKLLKEKWNVELLHNY